MTAVKRVGVWPATLTEPDLLDEPLELRPVRFSDAAARGAVRAANGTWLRRWFPTGSDEPRGSSRVARFATLARWSVDSPYFLAAYRCWAAWRGTAFTWAICYGGQFAGELTIWNVAWGVVRSAEVSYWVDKRFAGLGITPTALAMGADHCFQAMGLHRLEAGIQPENAASRRVVEKLGFRNEGTRARLVHIDGTWRDHTLYAITAEETPDGLLLQWRKSLAESQVQATLTRGGQA